MEPIGAFFDEEWESLNRVFFTEEPNLMMQLDGRDESNDELSFVTSEFCPNYDHDQANYDQLAGLVQSLFCSSNSTLVNSTLQYFPTPIHENYHFYDPNYVPIANYVSDFCPMDLNIESQVQVFNGDHMMQDNDLSLNEEMGSERLGNPGSSSTPLAAIADPGQEMKLKRKLDIEEEDKTNTNTSENPKKRTRVSRNATKSKKNEPKKKKQKLTENGNEEEETNGGPNGPSSSCCSSEDDCNTSESKGSLALNSNGKTRANRGSATDPQSLYARKRRERINERLKTLQNLVPNGTKVDISTMLEEAVQYVKFLQLQIKLLSSDDMWMYAPIAYNGMDMGLYQNISPTL